MSEGGARFSTGPECKTRSSTAALNVLQKLLTEAKKKGGKKKPVDRETDRQTNRRPERPNMEERG